MSEYRVTFDRLKDLIQKKLNHAGLSVQDSEIVSDCLATADLYGVSTHGTMVLPTYIKMIKDGRFNTAETVKNVKETDAFAVFDSNNTIGILSADKCMSYAVDKAETKGIFTVFSRNGNTYGPAFYYVLKAAQKGYIAFTCCNAPAAMTAPNGKEKLLGTNPFAMAVPSRSNEPIILDMASSIVAKSKINQYRMAGKNIPEGWAVDKDGKPTTDSVEAIKGFVQPMAGFKGYGIAMMIDILAGVLSGAAYLGGVGKFYSGGNQCMNVGQTFIAINPKLIYGEGFYEEMDEYISTVKGINRVDENTQIPLPGEDRLSAKNNNINGISIGSDMYELLTVK